MHVVCVRAVAAVVTAAPRTVVMVCMHVVWGCCTAPVYVAAVLCAFAMVRVRLVAL